MRDARDASKLGRRLGAALLVLAGSAAARAQEARVAPPAEAGQPTALEEAVGVVPSLDVATESGSVLIHVGGRLAVDAVAWGHANPEADDVDATDARVRVDIEAGPLRVLAEGDLLGTDTPGHLYEAWAELELAPFVRFRAGQIRVATTSEFATPEEDLASPGYGFTSHLSGRHDVGAALSGDVAGERLWYELVATSGHGFGLEGERLRSRQLGGRAVLRPFRSGEAAERDFLRQVAGGLLFGVGYWDLDDFDDPVIVSTPLEARTFHTTDLDGDGGGFLAWEVGLTAGPVQLGFERVQGGAEGVQLPLRRGGVPGSEEDLEQLTACAFRGAVNLTGEPQGWQRGRWVGDVRAEGDRTSGCAFGRVELAARYANADMDRDLLDFGLTTADPSTQEVRTLTLALNCFPDEDTRISLGWLNTIADESLTTFGGKGRDSSLFLRVDLRF